MRRIIALTGLAGAGKSTAASFLEERGFIRIRFAGPLKAMLRGLGLTERHIEGDLKEAPCDLLCGKTPRQVMQTLGTEWGRELVGENLWVNAWRESVLAALDQAAESNGRVTGIVAEDCRFHNEAFAVGRLGGRIWHISRPGLVAFYHASEREAGTLPRDRTIYNDGSVEDLRKATFRFLDEEIGVC